MAQKCTIWKEQVKLDTRYELKRKAPLKLVGNSCRENFGGVVNKKIRLNSNKPPVIVEIRGGLLLDLYNM